VLIFFMLMLARASEAYPSASTPQIISAGEAEILIYLLPVAHEIRSKGDDIWWEIETNQQLNLSDYYHFSVYVHSTKQSGSIAVGHYAVNKHTADVRNLLKSEIVNSVEIEGVQKILRRVHSIQADTIESFRSRGIWAGKD
jgi:hypothetical protein